MKLGKVTVISDKEISEDIKICLKNLYSTTTGNQPLDRDFGLDIDLIDKPIDVFINEYNLEVFEKTEKYEPRAKVRYIEFNFENDILTPKIYIELNREDEDSE